MAYSFGVRSERALMGVHPVLVQICERAIQLSSQDFGVYEGVRTRQRQEQLLAAKATRTLDSMHIPHVDRSGQSTAVYGHAVDLVPWISGEFRWEWGPCYEIAAAVGQAATEFGVAGQLSWGGVWDRWIADYHGDAAAMQAAVNAYVDRRRSAGKSAFIDGPHYQLYRMS